METLVAVGREWYRVWILSFIGSIVVTLGLSLPAWRIWLGSSIVTNTALSDRATFTGLLLSAHIAYLTSSQQRSGAAELQGTTSRFAWRHRLIIGSMGVCYLIGYLIAVSVCLLASDLSFSESGAAGLQVQVGVAGWFVFCASVGYVAGLRLPWAPLAVLLVPAGWALSAAMIRVPLLQNLLLLRGLTNPLYTIDWLFAVVLCIFYTSIGIAVLATRSAKLGAAVSASVCGIVAAVVLIVQGNFWVHVDQRLMQVSCSETSPRLCLSRAMEPSRAQLEPIVLSAWRVSAIVDPSPIAFLGSDTDPRSLSSADRVVAVTPRRGYEVVLIPNAESTLAGLVPSLLNPQNCNIFDSSSNRLTATPTGILVYWQFAKLGVDPSGAGLPRPSNLSNESDVVELTMKPDSEVSRILSGNLNTIYGCGDFDF